MKAGGGHEMKKFLLLVSILVVALMAAVIAYTTVDAMNRINNDAEREKQSVVQQLVDYFAESAGASAVLAMDPAVTTAMSEEVMEEVERRNMQPLMQFISAVLRPLYLAEYVTIVFEGDILGESVKEGVGFDDFQVSMPGDSEDVQYEILEEFDGEPGYYISVYYPYEAPGFGQGFFNFLLDRTEQIEAVDAVYDRERSNLITRQIIIGVVAIIVALLLTTIGVYYLARRYITGPIEKLADTSHRIMEGTFEGQVEVEEESDYVDIQRLLRSGKTILDRATEMEEE